MHKFRRDAKKVGRPNSGNPSARLDLLRFRMDKLITERRHKQTLKNSGKPALFLRCRVMGAWWCMVCRSESNVKERYQSAGLTHFASLYCDLDAE